MFRRAFGFRRFSSESSVGFAVLTSFPRDAAQLGSFSNFYAAQNMSRCSKTAVRSKDTGGTSLSAQGPRTRRAMFKPWRRQHRAEDP